MFSKHLFFVFFFFPFIHTENNPAKLPVTSIHRPHWFQPINSCILQSMLFTFKMISTHLDEQW